MPPAMRSIYLLLMIILTPIAAYYSLPLGPAPNPDPNHTHADFAVWVNGDKLDFSAEEFMSQSADEGEKHLHKYLHLHDGNGSVIHRHKPGLTLGEFFASLQVGFDEKCYASFAPLADGQICGDTPFRLYVNGNRRPFTMEYVFEDGEHILITNAANEQEVQAQLEELTDDACLYSRTCPERGDPPTENCIADPTVPCVAP